MSTHAAAHDTGDAPVNERDRLQARLRHFTMSEPYIGAFQSYVLATAVGERQLAEDLGDLMSEVAIEYPTLTMLTSAFYAAGGLRLAGCTDMYRDNADLLRSRALAENLSRAGVDVGARACAFAFAFLDQDRLDLADLGVEGRDAQCEGADALAQLTVGCIRHVVRTTGHTELEVLERLSWGPAGAKTVDITQRTDVTHVRSAAP